MARFSEEEVDLLSRLVETEIYEIQDSHLVQLMPEYLPFLRILGEKLEKYNDKHYSED